MTSTSRGCFISRSVHVLLYDILWPESVVYVGTSGHKYLIYGYLDPLGACRAHALDPLVSSFRSEKPYRTQFLLHSRGSDLLRSDSILFLAIILTLPFQAPTSRLLKQAKFQEAPGQGTDHLSLVSVIWSGKVVWP